MIPSDNITWGIKSAINFALVYKYNNTYENTSLESR